MTTFPFLQILTLSLARFALGVTSVYIAYASAELTQVRRRVFSLKIRTDKNAPKAAAFA